MVFLAKQAARESSLHVAIKYIPKQTIYESKGMARMQQEMNALQICDHPFIAHCFGGFEVGRKFYSLYLWSYACLPLLSLVCILIISLSYEIVDAYVCCHRVRFLLWWRAVPSNSNRAQNG